MHSSTSWWERSFSTERIARINGFSLKYGATPFFNEFVVTCPRPSASVCESLAKENIFAGVPVGERDLLVCVTETKSESDIDRFVEALAKMENRTT
jgi:glycine dehydrogenase subunit 1